VTALPLAVLSSSDVASISNILSDVCVSSPRVTTSMYLRIFQESLHQGKRRSLLFHFFSLHSSLSRVGIWQSTTSDRPIDDTASVRYRPHIFDLINSFSTSSLVLQLSTYRYLSCLRLCIFHHPKIVFVTRKVSFLVDYPVNSKHALVLS
jgi:hypothetical protein